MAVSYLNDKFFSRLETLSLELKSSLAGYFGGKHLVKTYGQTVEFADYREYQLGDDIRRIDWNLFSRFEKYFLKDEFLSFHTNREGSFCAHRHINCSIFFITSQ